MSTALRKIFCHSLPPASSVSCSCFSSSSSFSLYCITFRGERLGPCVPAPLWYIFTMCRLHSFFGCGTFALGVGAPVCTWEESAFQVSLWNFLRKTCYFFPFFLGCLYALECVCVCVSVCAHLPPLWLRLVFLGICLKLAAVIRKTNSLLPYQWNATIFFLLCSLM